MLSIASCATTEYVTVDREHIFPPMPEPIVLTPNSGTNEYLGVVKDIEWYKWGLFVKLETGIITEEKYDEKIHEANETLKKFDKMFQDYLDSLNPPE